VLGQITLKVRSAGRATGGCRYRLDQIGCRAEEILELRVEGGYALRDGALRGALRGRHERRAGATPTAVERRHVGPEALRSLNELLCQRLAPRQRGATGRRGIGLARL